MRDPLQTTLFHYCYYVCRIFLHIVLYIDFLSEFYNILSTSKSEYKTYTEIIDGLK